MSGEIALACACDSDTWDDEWIDTISEEDDDAAAHGPMNS